MKISFPTDRFYSLILILFLVSSCTNIESQNKDRQRYIIVGDKGYDWPSQEREYWPTKGWETANLEEHNMDAAKMEIAQQFAADDKLSRALLVVKDGYLVFEKYYSNGGPDKSSNLWSVTKSVTSALIGILVDQQSIASTDELMADLMPSYPKFNNIRLQNVLDHTTGLSWAESGQLWVDWIFSDDWVATALARGQITEVGKDFRYSSGNSHFLSALIKTTSKQSAGKLAKERLFDPLGIEFDTLTQEINYNDWYDYTKPLSKTWQQDPQGNEIGGFGLFLTARDMAKFGFLYLNRGIWNGKTIVSEDWVKRSVTDQAVDINEIYSYGYQWWITRINGLPVFLASGYGGQIIGVVPSLDLVVVIKYDAENPVHPERGTKHDDMHLFKLVIEAVNQ